MNIRIVTFMLVAAFPLLDANAQWFGSADAMMMKRSDSADTVFFRRLENASDPTTTSATVGNFRTTTEDVSFDQASDIDSDSFADTFNAAGRFSLGYRIDDFFVMGSYLLADTAEYKLSEDSPLGLLVDPSVTGSSVIRRTVTIEDLSPPGPPTSNSTTITVRSAPDDVFSRSIDILYQSELDTADICAGLTIYSGPRGDVAFLGGVRYLELEESFQFTRMDIAAAQFSANTQTRNRMFGPEIGLQAVSPLANLGFLRADWKTSFAYNEIDKSIVGQDGLGVPVTFSDDLNSGSWINELNFEASLGITRHFEAHIGFQLLAISDLALANENFYGSTAIAPTSADAVPITDGSVVYYSPYFGFSLIL